MGIEARRIERSADSIECHGAACIPFPPKIPVTPELGAPDGRARAAASCPVTARRFSAGM
jgi:hypothetical protein